MDVIITNEREILFAQHEDGDAIKSQEGDGKQRRIALCLHQSAGFVWDTRMPAAKTLG